MPKKKEPTETTVSKETKKPAAKQTASAATPAVKSPAAEAAKPAPAKAAEKPVTPAPAPAAPAPAPAKAAEKPATPAPAPAVPAPAPAKAAEKPAAAKAAKPAAHAQAGATVIVAKYDVGHGNNMFIRGEGAGLSWDSGIQMENAGNDVWVWTTNEAGAAAVSFKFLINDVDWSTGDNMTAPAGETTTLYPAF